MDGKSRTTDWNAIWVAMQELGAALYPVVESGDAPRWASRLRSALDNANDQATKLALEQVGDQDGDF